MNRDKYYKHFNLNSEGNKDAVDCVTGTLCVVSGLSQYEVYNKYYELVEV